MGFFSRKKTVFNAKGIQNRLFKAGLIMSTPEAWGYKNGKPAKLSLHYTSVNSQQKLNNFRNQKLRYYANKLGLNINELKRLSEVLNTNNNINMLSKIRTYYQKKRKNKPILPSWMKQ